MSEPDFTRWDDLECSFDFDPAHWLPVPRTDEPRPRDEWARACAQAWASDYGYPAGGPWEDILTRMLETVARGEYTIEPYLMLAYVRDVPNAAPWVQPVTVLLHFDEPDAARFAVGYAQTIAGDAVRPPVEEVASLPDGTEVAAVTTHARDDDGSILLDSILFWRGADGMVVSMHAAGDDIGYLAEMRNDMLTQAALIRFVQSGAVAEGASS